ncbi:unnamed protein product [Rotaria socialis]|uniref:Uncharacterized protein n=1 Tax=Rotaria socialis TaxID=392032 RepID=A0A818IUM2_9BILA|nr:unnamed protein product [Rotaria socialis]CAF4827125.1 unnamed protein product [Rotaria socialis]
MPRRCHGCFPICCISSKRRRSFSINEKPHKKKVNKVNPQQAENVQIIPSAKIIQQQDKKPETIKKKPVIEEIQPETHVPDQQTNPPSNKDNKSSCSETSLSKFFHKSKQLKVSALALAINDVSDDNDDKTANNTISSWSSLTYSGPTHRPNVQSYDFVQKNDFETIKISNDINYTERSKLVLDNVKKLLKDQQQLYKKELIK